MILVQMEVILIGGGARTRATDLQVATSVVRRFEPLTPPQVLG